MRVDWGKLKALFGTSLAGGLVGGVLGGASMAAAALTPPGGVSLWTAAGDTTAMALFRAFASGGFTSMLTLSRGGDSLRDLSLLRTTAMGAGAKGTSLPALSGDSSRGELPEAEAS